MIRYIVARTLMCFLVAAGFGASVADARPLLSRGLDAHAPKHLLSLNAVVLEAERDRLGLDDEEGSAASLGDDALAAFGVSVRPKSHSSPPCSLDQEAFEARAPPAFAHI